MNESGIWTLEEAQKAHAYTAELAQNLCKLFRKDKPVLDLGCGVGFYSSYLNKEGYTVHAYEGTPGIEEISLYKPIHPLDLSQPLDPSVRGQVLCLEVGEHIPAEHEETVLRNLANAADELLVLSWAVPGQGGLGHVNERTNDYVIAKIQSLGLEHDPEASQFLRQDVGECWWFRNTLLVFRKPTLPAPPRPAPASPALDAPATAPFQLSEAVAKLLGGNLTLPPFAVAAPQPAPATAAPHPAAQPKPAPAAPQPARAPAASAAPAVVPARALFQKMLAGGVIVRLKTSTGEQSGTVVVQTDGLASHTQTRDHFVRFEIEPGYIRLTLACATEHNSGDVARCDWATNDPLDGTVHLHVRASGLFGFARATVQSAYAIQYSALEVLHALTAEAAPATT